MNIEQPSCMYMLDDRLVGLFRGFLFPKELASYISNPPVSGSTPYVFLFSKLVLHCQEKFVCRVSRLDHSGGPGGEKLLWQ